MASMNQINLSPIQLSQLLITRYSHDIVGPIGAVNNGIEFLQENDKMEEQAISLITDSAKQAINRIQFYRYLYGILKEQDSVSFDDKKNLVEAFYESSKIKLNWLDNLKENSSNLNAESLRIICSLIFIAGTSLIRGGEVKIYSKNMDNIIIEAVGTNIIFHADAQNILLGNNSFIPDSNNIQIIYTKMLIDNSGAKILFELNDNSLKLNYQPLKT
jgi:histidine phosphotransferase ChpT